MALHRKWDILISLKPDIAVIPEAASAEILQRNGVDLSLVSWLWVPAPSQSPYKGLLVLGFNGWRLQTITPRSDSHNVFLPFRAERQTKLNLLAAWAFNHRGNSMSTAEVVTLYADFLSSGMLIGDLNNNVLWDKPKAKSNFANAVENLGNIGLKSLYHACFKEDFGEEGLPTLYWRQRTENGPRYHIDYIFAPERWINQCSNFQLGSFDDWVGSKLSDHVPLISDWSSNAFSN